MNTDKALVRQGSKTKAGLAAAAAIAVLLGGASTFARWAEEADLMVTGNDTDVIQAGGLDISISGGTLESVAWYDTSPEMPADGCPAGLSGNSWSTGVTPGYLGFDTEFEACEISALADFPIVPGDQLTGIVGIDLSDTGIDVTELVGEHLRVCVAIDGLNLEDATISGTFHKIWGDILRVTVDTEDDRLDPGQLLVTIDYEWGSTEEATAHFGHHGDAQNGTPAQLSDLISIADVTVLVEQYRTGVTVPTGYVCSDDSPL